MKALADKVEAADLPLVIEVFELDDIFTEGKIGLFEAGHGHRALVNCPDSKNELAEVFIILVREDAVEDARPETIDVEK